jgi:hypothetical protein
MQTVAEARKELESINPFEYNITILSQQPGIGKSTWARKYCNDHTEIEKIGIFSKRHNFLTECESNIEDFSHWKGRGRLCNRPDKEWFKNNDSITIPSPLNLSIVITKIVLEVVSYGRTMG